MKKYCLCTILHDHLKEQYGFSKFEKSFKYFHPDIDFIHFGTKMIEQEFKKVPGLKFGNLKFYFPQLVMDDYELVVFTDSDHLCMGRWDEVFCDGYDVGACAGYNTNWNIGLMFDKPDEMVEASYLVQPNEMVHNGILGSRNKDFWRHGHEISLKHAHHFVFGDCDILNVIFHYGGYKNTKVFDGDLDYRNKNFKYWYNCSILGQEYMAYMDDDKVMLHGKQMKAYHWAGGMGFKLNYEKRFKPEVCQFLNKICL